MTKQFFTSKGAWEKGIFIVRLLTAMMIIPYGLELFSQNSMKELTGFLAEIHFPLPVLMGYLAKIAEFFGGILLAAGLFTRIITVPMALTMCGVIYTMGGGNIFNSETPFLFLLLFMAFFLYGPGKYSFDYWLFDRRKVKTH